MREIQSWRDALRLNEAATPSHTMTHAAKSMRAIGYCFSDEEFREWWHFLRGTEKRPYNRRKPTQDGKEALAWDKEVNPPEAVPEAPEKPLAGGEVEAPDQKRRSLDGKRFVFTYAQNNTYLHEDFWLALQHFCAVNDAQLGVSKGTYNKAGWQKHGGVSADDEEEDGLWYDERIFPYIINENVRVANGLVLCGELDILPTAKDPLSGLENYTGPKSGIIPHPKMHMKSLATMKYEDAKFLYTTGACTLRNYLQRKAGQVATYHHVFGALYVEIDDEGNWFARQLNATDDGVFYDLDTAYGPGWHRPAAEFGRPIINLGDIHVEKLDPLAMAGAMDMVSVLKPEAVMFHDIIDFENRNHHNLKDPYFLAEQHKSGRSVKLNLLAAVTLLHHFNTATDNDADLYVIRSNHDQALDRWLRDADGHFDPINACEWHKWNWMKFHAIQADIEQDLFADIMFGVALEKQISLRKVRFVKEDESLILRSIEFGMHGHRGPNGARGNPRAYRQLGRKSNTGHTHSAGIVDGIYTAGVLARLDMGYNVGPSSWSHSHIITYPSGKRAIITQRGNKWRA